MGKITGFIEFEREKQPYRPIEERVQDWHQVMQAWPVEPLKVQAARCMDCGIPFCHEGCPLGNLIPDWNAHRLRVRPSWTARGSTSTPYRTRSRSDGCSIACCRMGSITRSRITSGCVSYWPRPERSSTETGTPTR